MSSYDETLGVTLRRLLDPKGVKRMTVNALVQQVIDSRDEGWRQATRLAAEVAALRAKYEPSTPPVIDETLDAYWTRGT